uniref:Protein FAM200B-like n=1 Tax=Crassostrea virginica TaxID=6565 RepID=A0A8B8D7T8_CRAVI|nr:protein FAM200B-like [Crassostrea virginica]
MVKAREAAISKSKAAIISALRNVYFAAINNLANALIPKLNDLCIDQVASQLRDLVIDSRTTYSHNQSIQEFQHSIAKVIEDKLIGQVRESGVFSIMLDESSDVSVHQNLVVYVRYLEQAFGRLDARTSFLGLRQLDIANSDRIREQVVKLLVEKGLDVSKLAGIATDGASVMVGCRAGVVQQMKALSPSLLVSI